MTADRLAERRLHSSGVAVIVDLALDIYLEVESGSPADEKIHLSGSRRDVGGTGVKAAAAILALGGPTLHGLVGLDAIGDAAMSLLHDKGTVG